MKEAVLFALSANKKMAQKIAEEINIHLAEAELLRFADGEIYVAPNESVRNKNVFILQSTCPPVTERLMEVLVFIDALRRASCRSVTIIAPYFGYSRQDRKSRPREPITARLVADMLQVAGADRVVVFDLHTQQMQGFFRIPVDNCTAIPLFAEYIQKEIKDKNITIVSPDHGGVSRVRMLASLIDAPFAIIDKRRLKTNVAEVLNIVGNVQGQTCILLDDIIDTGGTIVKSAQALKDAGASKVICCATHALFSDNAQQHIDQSVISQVIITDSIEHQLESSIKVLSIAHLISKIIVAVQTGMPVSEIYK